MGGAQSEHNLCFEAPQGAQSCTHRWPRVGDMVVKLEGGDKLAAHGWRDAWALQPFELAWTLQPFEVATVVEVDEDGDFRLRNTQGRESGFTFRNLYAYIQVRRRNTFPQIGAIVNDHMLRRRHSWTPTSFQPVPAHIVDLDKIKQLSKSSVVDCRYHFEEDRSLKSDYEVCSEVLGAGLGGQVVVVHSRSEHQRYAFKTLNKAGTERQRVLSMVAEVEIHLSMQHPNIALVRDVYESASSIYMVTECCEGGQLYASLQEKGTYGNDEAAEVTRQMLRVIRHLHAKGIVHRDLKLENFLYHCKDPHAQMDKFLSAMRESNGSPVQAEPPQLKLIDFGFANVWDKAELMTASCGTADYVSPDILCREGYTDKTDIWSLAVIVWMLLVGYPPFHGEKQAMLDRIQSGCPDWSHQSRWKKVSPDAVDFVQKILVKQPEQRLDAQEALLHRWLKSISPLVQSPYTGPQTVCAVQRHTAGPKAQRAALEPPPESGDQLNLATVEDTRTPNTFHEDQLEKREGLLAPLMADGDPKISSELPNAMTTSSHRGQAGYLRRGVSHRLARWYVRMAQLS